MQFPYFFLCNVFTYFIRTKLFSYYTAEEAGSNKCQWWMSNSRNASIKNGNSCYESRTVCWLQRRGSTNECQTILQYTIFDTSGAIYLLTHKKKIPAVCPPSRGHISLWENGWQGHVLSAISSDRTAPAAENPRIGSSSTKLRYVGRHMHGH
jgi:hypothetical protein